MGFVHYVTCSALAVSVIGFLTQQVLLQPAGHHGAKRQEPNPCLGRMSDMSAGSGARMVPGVIPRPQVAGEALLNSEYAFDYSTDEGKGQKGRPADGADCSRLDWPILIGGCASG